MRKILVAGTVGGIGYLAARAKLPKLHEQMMAKCQGMFQQMAGHASATGGGGAACGGVAQSPCGPAASAEEVHDAA